MKRNTMTRREYLFCNLYWVSILFFLYNVLVFRCIFGTRHGGSVAILTAFVLVGTALGMLFTFKNRRNTISIICNLALAFGPYFLITFWRAARKPLTLAAQLTATLVACYLLFLLISYIHRRTSGATGVSTGQFIAACVRISTRLVLLALASVMAFTMGKVVLGFAMLSPSQSTAQVVTGPTRQASILENVDTLLLLEDSQWSNLNPTQRLNVLAVVGRIEAKALSIPEVDIGASVLDDSVWAQYSPMSQTIAINLVDLPTMSAERALSTLCHEYYHAYQHNLVMLYDTLSPEAKQLPLFHAVATYKREFQHYVDGSFGSNYDRYSAQLCELTSDQHAEAALDEYRQCLSQYVSDNNITFPRPTPTP